MKLRQDKIMTTQSEQLVLMRQPFKPNQIGKLVKGSKEQSQCPPAEKKNCNICGGWHHPKMAHLDYVGHAALTDRLLDVDPLWTWEPVAFQDGLPKFDATGGLWIKLTVCGVTRMGYGNAEPSQYKEVGSREKEVIGDALRNAAMRFGAALELWHKGDLHKEEPALKPAPQPESRLQPYDEAEFNAKSQVWLQKIMEGTLSLDAVIKGAKSQGRLLTEQQITILKEALV